MVTTCSKLTASLLCADALALSDDLTALQQADVDYLHVDMADGHFVPLLGIGIEEAKQVRRATQIPFDVHLLVDNPHEWVPRVLAELRPAIVTFQVEAAPHAYRLAQIIRQHGALAGVGLNPGTPPTVLEYLLPTLDLVLLMTTNPGFTRQTLIPSMFEKIAAVRRLSESKGMDLRISVDGNVSFEHAPRMAAAGADMLVCGSSSIFDRSRGGIVAATAAFRACLGAGSPSTAYNNTPGIESASGAVPGGEFSSNAAQIAAEIAAVLKQIDPGEVDQLATALLAARRVFIFAVGRVLMSLECLGKRLNHLGIECHVVGAMNEPPIGLEDLLLIASGSGESRLPAEIARLAKSHGAQLALFTSASTSTIKALSDIVVHLPCPTKKEPNRGVQSIQLMSTLFDQSLHVVGDALALTLQSRQNLSSSELWQRHANLE